jgi:oligosaccharide repeat unit polymerase
MWSVVVLGSNLLTDFPSYSADFYLYLFSALFFFSMFFYMPYYFSKRIKIVFEWGGKKNREYFWRKTPKNIINLYLSFMLISVILQSISHFFLVGDKWFLPSGIELYRLLETTGGGVKPLFTWVKIFNYFFFSCLPILITYGHEAGRGKVISLCFLLVIFIYLSTARSCLFTVVLIGFFFYAHFIKKNYRAIFFGIFALFVLFLGFALIAQLVGKYTGNNLLSFYGYLFAPSHALDQIILGVRHGDPAAIYTFRPFLGVLEHVGLIEKQPFLLPYFSNPTVNVYTMFGCYILDYGVVGSMVVVSILGFISGVIYCKAKIALKAGTNGPFVFFSSLNLAILVLGVFYDYYTSAGYVWVSLFAAPLFFPKDISKYVGIK